MVDRNINDMTESEIHAVIFGNSRQGEFIGMRKTSDTDPRGLTDAEIYVLPSHPCFHQFSQSLRSWVWATIEELLEAAYGPITR